MSARAVFILALMFFAAQAFAQFGDDRHPTHVSVQEFEFEGKAYNRILIDDSPARFTTEYRAGSDGAWNQEKVNRYSQHGRFAAYLLTKVQEHVLVNYAVRGRSEDGRHKDTLIENEVLKHPDPWGWAASRARTDGDDPPSRVGEVMTRPFKTIVITDKNDLNMIRASGKVIESDHHRLNYHFSKIDRDYISYEERTARNDQAKAEGLRIIEIENLSMERGPIDFLELLIRSLYELDFLESRGSSYYRWVNKTRLYLIASDKPTRALYLAMGFRTEVTFQGQYRMFMDGAEFASSSKRFLAGEIVNREPVDAETERLQQIIMATRAKKRPMQMAAVKHVDLESTWGKTDYKAYIGPQTGPPEFTGLKSVPKTNRCRVAIDGKGHVPQPFYKAP